MPTYDLAVIGGGTAGLVASAGAAGIGARVALVERHRLGGECLWTGCVPSKALIAAARAAADVRHARKLGVASDGLAIDFPRVMHRVREVQRRIEPHDSPDRFRALGVDVISGEARFVGERTLAVNGRRIAAKRILIATGSRAAVPPIPGFADVPFLTNETVFDIDELPPRLLVLGAGAIGLELAQAFARLGSHVRVVEALPVLLPREDDEMVRLLAAALALDGVSVLLGAKATRVERRAGAVVLTADRATTLGGEERVELEGDALLVAVGRQANVETLELATAGVAAGDDGVTVDQTLRTTAAGVWASGDVTGGLRFTHVADYQSRLVVRNAFFPLAAKADYSAVPWVTYTDPELAHVGLTEREARERHGGDVRIWRHAFEDVDRAVADGRPEGMVKLITTRRGRILGGHILGHGAGNMIGEITLAMRHGLPLGKIASVIHPYPTYPEAIKQAANSYYKAKLTGPVKSVARWFARR